MTSQTPAPPEGEASPAADAPFRCSLAARARADSQVGTASPTKRWLLIENPGPWESNAFSEAKLGPIGPAIKAHAIEMGLRPLMIRRPGRDAKSKTRRWAIVDSRPGNESVRWGRYADLSELLELDLDPDSTADGEMSADPIYLICTHGKHDTCCAINGRPVASAIAEIRSEQTWECSHLGGDRFAANVVALPQGLYYGYVVAHDALELVTAHDHGRIVPRLFRGRSSLPAFVQAAQHCARDKFGEDRIDSFALLKVMPTEPGEWDITLDGSDAPTHVSGPIVVGVRTVTSGPFQATCSGPAGVLARSFEATSIEVAK